MKTKSIRLLPLLLLLVISGAAIANPVDLRTAREVAMKFMNANAKVPLRSAEDLQLASTYSISRGDAAFHVFNTPNGFVIVAADDCAHPILGYADEGRPFDAEHVPIQLQDILQGYVEQIGYGIEHHLAADEKTEEQWRRVRVTGRLSNIRDNEQVGPLLTTTWDQGQYYNAMCPEDANGPDGHVYTGCVATAMAQIIKYWGHPVSGRGIHSYDSNYGTLTVNYEESYYDFDNMPDALNTESTTEQVEAVAKLMYDCGVAVNMDYGTYQSTAYIYNVVTAMVNHFAFDPQLGLAQREPYSDLQWSNLIRLNIDSGKPICYTSNSTSVGHSYVLDGYNCDDYFHLNFGWNGSADGWYNLLSIVPNSDFSYNQSAILGIQPNCEASVLIGNTEWSKFFVHDVLDLYDSYALNPYHFGQSNNSTGNDTIVLVSDNDEQLVIDFLRYNGGGIEIYDGQNADILIREIVDYTYPINNNTSPVISSLHALTLVCSSNLYRRDFHLRIAKASSCRTVSDIIATVDSTTVHLTWVENGCATQWQVEYGPEGFETGTTIETQTTDTVLYGFVLDSIYELRIRSVCDIGNYGPTNKILINKKVYWTDVVSEKPEGYSINSDGVITISSAEGLAWVSKITSQSPYDGSYNGLEYIDDGIRTYTPREYTRHKIQLESDIDLSGFLWKSMAWAGDVDGNGHVISNMHAVCYDGWAKGGLFYEFGGDTIQDIGFINAVTEGLSGGTIAGNTQGIPVVINCYSDNCTIFSSGYTSESGGLLGLSYAIIINCYASGKMYGSRMGGLVGSGAPEMYNCYSSVNSFDYPIGYRGLLRASGEGGTFINCYADIDKVEDTWSSNYIGTLYDENNTALGYLLGTPQLLGDVRNLAGFTRQDGTMARIAPEVAVNYYYEDTLDLVTALNNWVIEKNIPKLRTWVWDSITGFPVFGDYYVVSCPNVSNVNAVNIPFNDGFAVALSWQENGDASEWQIKCLPSGIVDGDSAVYYSAFETNYIISGLALGKTYDIYVRPVCDESGPVVWGAPIKFFVDKAYWFEVVTTCPDGYEEDVDGNVIISSAEGLAWLAVCSNGLNGQMENNYSGKTVHLACDIDLGQYKWIPIGYHKSEGTIRKVFMGSFLGHGHTISNLYCYEEIPAAGSVGLFGQTLEAFISELNIENVLLDGYYNVGALCGGAYNTTIIDCHTSNVVVKGVANVGGVIGVMGYYNGYNYQSVFYDNSASGVIYGDQRAGGLIGNASSCYISNSYSNCDVIALALTGSESLGGLIGYSNAITKNCYCVGSVEYSWYICGYSSGLLIGSFGPDAEIHNAYVQQSGSLSLFGSTWGLVPEDRISDTSLIIGNQLNTEIVFNDASYSDLLSALNAWVDANNTEGHYLHWVADTAMVNGGFPIHEEPMSPTVQLQSLPSGWSWYAPTVQTSIESIGSSLGNNLVLIQVKDGTPSGNVVAGQMYKLQTTAPCTLAVTGVPFTTATVTISHDENWFGYIGTEKAVGEVFDASFGPAVDDKVISQDEGFAIFNGTEWEGTLNALVPGKGYVYVSNAAEPKTLVIGE